MTEARTRSVAGGGALDGRVAGVVDDISVVPDPAGHDVDAEAAVQRVVAGEAEQRVIAAEPAQDIGGVVADYDVGEAVAGAGDGARRRSGSGFRRCCRG